MGIPKAFILGAPIILGLSGYQYLAANDPKKPRGHEAVVVESAAVTPNETTAILAAITSATLAGGFAFIWSGLRHWRTFANFYEQIRWTIPHTPQFLLTQRQLKRRIILQGALWTAIVAGALAFGLEGVRILSLQYFPDYIQELNESGFTAKSLHPPSKEDVNKLITQSSIASLGLLFGLSYLSPYILLPALVGLSEGTVASIFEGKVYERLENFQRNNPDVQFPLLVTPVMERQADLMAHGSGHNLSHTKH